MRISPFWNVGVRHHLWRLPESARAEFGAAVRLSNARRLRIIYSIVSLGTLAFWVACFAMASPSYLEHRFLHFFSMDMGLVIISLGLTFLCSQNDPAQNPARHHAILVISLVALTSLLSMSAGLEYVTMGAINRFYITLFALSTSVLLPPLALCIASIWSLAILAGTVVTMGGSASGLLATNPHLIPLLILGVAISRGNTIGFIRDFLLMQKLAKTNASLTREVEEKNHALDRLATSKKEFEETFEFAPDPYILTAPSGTILRINQCAAELIGLSSQELQGVEADRIPTVTGENARLVMRTIHQTVLCGHSGPCQLHAMPHPKGGRLYLELHASLIHHAEREMVLIVARDSTHRKKAEGLLQESKKRLEERVQQRTRELERINIRLKEEINERIATEAALARAEHYYRMLVENMNEGLAIFDARGCFTYANECLCRMTGHPREYLMGKDNTMVVHPDDHGLVFQRRELRNRGDRTPYEVRLLTANDKEANILVSPEPMIDEAGHFKGSFVVITNITKLKKMDAALRRNELQARALLNASSDAAILLTPDGTILEANEITCTLMNAPRESLVELSAAEVFEQYSKPNHVDHFRRAVTLMQTRQFVDEDHKGNTFEVTIHPIAHENRVDLVAVFARDITTLKQAEKQIRTLSQELIKAQENERQRIAMDLHDNVAQDLATLKIGLDTLFDPHIEMPTEVGQRLLHLSRLLKDSIQNIRGLAYNLQPPELEQLGLITAISRFCDEQSTRYGIHIDLFTAGVRELTLTFDTQINIYRLVQEALTNIRKHAEASRVTIRLTASHPRLILCVEDDGKGFSVKQRLSEAISEKRMGVRSMEERVSLLGGAMKLTSTPGEGTRLRVNVPVIPRNDRTKTA